MPKTSLSYVLTLTTTAFTDERSTMRFHTLPKSTTWREISESLVRSLANAPLISPVAMLNNMTTGVA